MHHGIINVDARFGSADIRLRPVDVRFAPKASVLGTCVATDKIGFVLQFAIKGRNGSELGLGLLLMPLS
jgi:hypothetical protein